MVAVQACHIDGIEDVTVEDEPLKTDGAQELQEFFGAADFAPQV
jgi:hypothetical protein